MKIVRFAIGRKTSYGVLDGEFVTALQGSPFRAVKTTGQRHAPITIELYPPAESFGPR